MERRSFLARVAVLLGAAAVWPFARLVSPEPVAETLAEGESIYVKVTETGIRDPARQAFWIGGYWREDEQRYVRPHLRLPDRVRILRKDPWEGYEQIGETKATFYEWPGADG